MQMPNVITNYRAAEKEFELFCKAREWTWVKFGVNPKNSLQYLGICLDDTGMDRKFLISQNSRYYELLGDGKFRKTEYVLGK